MSRKLFGTDGVRGVANSDLTPELAFSIGLAAGAYLAQSGQTKRVALGRDTRRSGSMLGAALASGFCASGADVVALGVVPTGAISYVARNGDFGMGAVVSASHNPAPDNGIKLIGHDGRKLSDDAELAIEKLMEENASSRPTGEKVGKIDIDRFAIDAYFQFLLDFIPERLDGMRIACDCAHGAAFEIAQEVFRELGAELILTGVEPDGMNINADGGATKPDTIQKLTKSSGAKVGMAFDGDADRVVFSDERGRLINGDRAMGIWCSHWQKCDDGGGARSQRVNARLDPPIAIGTVMTNSGLETFLKGKGIKLERTPVGDKYVSKKMDETGAKIGGEQSGHIIFADRGPTGDGLVTALEILRVLKRENKPASEYVDAYQAWPQVLINVKVAQKDIWDRGPKVSEALSNAKSKLDGGGRLIARASGTQPMVRIMVEAKDANLRDDVAESILNALKKEAGGEVYSRVDLTHALGD